jgi:hypothetical protein
MNSNDAQRDRINQRRQELKNELQALDQQERNLSDAEKMGGDSPTQPGSASRTSTGEPGKYDNPGATQPGQTQQPQQAPMQTPAQHREQGSHDRAPQAPHAAPQSHAVGAMGTKKD